MIKRTKGRLKLVSAARVGAHGREVLDMSRQDATGTILFTRRAALE